MFVYDREVNMCDLILNNSILFYKILVVSNFGIKLLKCILSKSLNLNLTLILH